LQKLFDLAEVNLALKLSVEIEERLKKPVVETKPLAPPKKPLPPQKSVISKEENVPAGLFQLTSTPSGSKGSNSGVAKQLTPLSSEIINTNVTKLKKMEDDFKKQLMAIREAQEKQVRVCG
jgi:hypothetical protein